jgi:hypothetical protein
MRRWPRRRVGALFVAVAVAALAALAAASARPATTAPNGVVCNGQERWPVKTLSDLDVDQVRLDPSQIKQTTVKALRQKKKPPGSGEPDRNRIGPVETTVYEVKAALVEARWIWNTRESVALKKKGDRDIHLVIAAASDPALTMIVEFPDPACVKAAPALKKMIRDARNAFIDCEGLMPSADKPFKPLTGTATINGVGFFDRPHATGHAPSGIELHPVLAFSSTDCPK